MFSLQSSHQHWVLPSAINDNGNENKVATTTAEEEVNQQHPSAIPGRAIGPECDFPLTQLTCKKSTATVPFSIAKRHAKN